MDHTEVEEGLQMQQFQKGSSGISNCAAYMQLFAGWLVLNLLTFMMATVPHSAQFLDIEPGFNWASGHPESDRARKGPPQFSWMDSSVMVLDERYIVYGLWVLVEIALFFVLLVTATAIMCSCKHVPPGAGFIHLMVDPVFVTLGSVPFLLIRGLPRAAALQACLIHSPPNYKHYTSSNSNLNPPIKYFTSANNNVTNVALGVRVGPGVQCLMALPYKLPTNITLLDNAGNIPLPAQAIIQHNLRGWLTLLQCAVLAPTILRLVHFRWKMSWQPFLHSNIYFFIQALDCATLVQLSTRIHGAPWNLICQTLTYMASLALCIGCLTISIPPVYTGNQVTNKYLKWSTYIGTVLIDVPFLVLRLYAVIQNGVTVDLKVEGVFFAMIIKELVYIFGCIWISFRKVSRCVGSTYLSLSIHDPDFEEYEMNGVEQYV